MHLQLLNHGGEHLINGKEPLVSLTNVGKPLDVVENAQHDVQGDSFADSLGGFDDTQAERNDLGGEQESNYLGIVVLHQGANNPQRGEPEVLVGLGVAAGVQERVQIEQDVAIEERQVGFWVRSNALQQLQRVAHPVAHGNVELRGVQ